jgi:hypothetical protein
MQLSGRSNLLGALGFGLWLVSIGVAWYLSGLVGVGIVMCLTTAGLFCSTVYRYTQHGLSRSRLYREGGNHVMLFGLGLLWIGPVLEGWIATAVGLVAYALVFVGFCMIGWWWRSDRTDETVPDHELDR